MYWNLSFVPVSVDHTKPKNEESKWPIWKFPLKNSCFNLSHSRLSERYTTLIFQGSPGIAICTAAKLIHMKETEISLSGENELVVMIPAVLFHVGSRFKISYSSCSRSTAAHHLETLVVEHVESLLQEKMFQKESAGVSAKKISIWS